jgi:misacylated tRNA(Ala) deacylase
VEPTLRLYWEDHHCFETEARVVGFQDDAIAFDQTCFYPGAGGQPSDSGTVTLNSGLVREVVSARAGADEVVWHVVSGSFTPSIAGQSAKLSVNRERRVALARHHTVLHVLNTIALRDYSAWITGVQIGVDYSRIDFKWEGKSAGNRRPRSSGRDRGLRRSSAWRDARQLYGRARPVFDRPNRE